LLLAMGVNEQDICTMVSKNNAGLLGLEF